jgi:catechol 2,3-dioxygenase-like lactoylglutathione lyase family enzyme
MSLMLGPYGLVAFVLTNDAPRAKKFYAETLGLRFVSQDDYAVVFDANGVMLRVSLVAGHTPSEHPVLGWNVPDIAAAAAGLIKAGVKFEKYSFVEQDELGIWSSPDGNVKVAWFKDPDGNVLSISQL